MIGSAVIPTIIANAAFLPTHLLPQDSMAERIDAVADGPV